MPSVHRRVSTGSDSHPRTTISRFFGGFFSLTTGKGGTPRPERHEYLKKQGCLDKDL